MTKGRLEAFSDGVFAIAITIMVLELKVPHGKSTLADLKPLLPIFFSYVLSYVYLGVYWSNHHNMMFVAKKVNGKIIWDNLNLLFWFSLVPFATAWMGQNYLQPTPTALYGVVLMMAAISYYLLQSCILCSEGEDSMLLKAIGKDLKGKLSVGSYIAATAIAYYVPWVSFAIYVLVAMIWFIPDKRIERDLS